MWNETFAVGHDGLDEEHRRLVAGINELCAAAQAKQTPQQLRTLLNALKLSAEDHFRHENSVLREISDGVRSSQPDRRLKRPHLKAMSDAALEEHIAEHTLAIARLELIIRASLSGTDAAESVLCLELKGWFLEHMIKADAHLKAIFQAM